MVSRRDLGWIAALLLVACRSDSLGIGDDSDLAGTGPGAFGVPMYHRADDSRCSSPPAAGNCNMTQGGQACSTDADCMGLNARCIQQMGPAGCECTHDTCVHDTDCPSGTTCICHEDIGGNSCQTSNCRVDADCGAGQYCSPTYAVEEANTCPRFAGYSCHTKADLCVNDSDCPVVNDGPPLSCVWVPADLRWECQPVPFCL